MENLNEKISLANLNFENENYDEAIKIYNELIEQNKSYVFFCNRSAAYYKQKKYDLSLEDAIQAKSLNQNSIKAYYREGMALKGLNKNLEAIIAFCKGLELDENNVKILETLLNTLVDTSFWKSIEPSLNQLKTIESKLNSFLVLSLIGQHILSLNYFYESSVILNCCLKMNTESQKLKSSVYSSIAFAYWKLKNYKYALNSMEKDLECSINLNDFKGQFRALENLGSAYFQLEKYDYSLNYHKKQLEISKKNDVKENILISLNSIGNVYYKLNNYEDAVLSFKEYLFLAEATNNIETIINGLRNLVECNKKIKNFQIAIKYQEEICNYTMKLYPADEHNSQKNLYSLINLGELYFLVKNFKKSSKVYEEALNLSIKNNLDNLQPLIYNQLANCELELSNLLLAKKLFEKQLKFNKCPNKKLNSNCLMNLGDINFKLNNYQAALEYYEILLNDGNEKTLILNKLADCYFNLKDFDKSIKSYKELLSLKNENSINRIQIMKNLINCYSKTNKLDDILKTYFDILNYSKKTQNKKECLWSYFQIGCCYLKYNVYDQSILIFQEYLNVLNDNSEDNFSNNKVFKNETYDLKENNEKILNILALVYLKNNNFKSSLNYFLKNKKLIIRLNEFKKTKNFQKYIFNEINMLNSNETTILIRLFCTFLNLEIKNEKNNQDFFDSCFILNDEKVMKTYETLIDELLKIVTESINC